MEFGVLGDLNWLAVIVAGLLYYALGALWYAQAVFGRTWQQSMGWQPPDDYRPSPLMYLVPLVTCLVTAIAVGMLAEASATDTFGEGIVLGLVAGIGVAAASLYVTGFFDPQKPKPMTTTAINSGYHVVGILLVGAIVGSWT